MTVLRKERCEQRIISQVSDAKAARNYGIPLSR